MYSRISPLNRIFQLIKPHPIRLLIATVSLILNSALSFLYPQAARYAIDIGIKERSLTQINYIAGAALVVFVLHSLIIWTRHYMMSWLGQNAVTRIRQQVFKKLLELSPAWFHSRNTGEIVSRLSSDVTIIEGLVSGELSLALRHGVIFVVGIIFAVLPKY